MTPFSSHRYHIAMQDVVIWPAERLDIPEIAAMCHSLWPDAGVEEHARQLISLLAAQAPGKLPAVLGAQQPSGGPVGFIEAGLRSHADGCDPSHPVGYIEGWYVAPPSRRRKIGARVIAAAED